MYMNNSQVEFKGYSISKLEMKKIEELKNKKEENFEIKIGYFQNIKDKLSYKLVMKLKIVTKKQEISMDLEGYFKFGNTFDQQLVEEFLRINGSMILYPYCRAIVSSITNLDSDDSVILPVINFKDYQFNKM